MQSGPSGATGQSTGSSGSSEGSSGSSNESSGNLNESSSNLNGSSAAGDSSSLDSLADGLSASVQGSSAGSNLLRDSIKARTLPFGRLWSKRADFTCMHRLPSPSSSFRNASVNALLTVSCWLGTEAETCYTVNNGLFCANGRYVLLAHLPSFSAAIEFPAYQC